MTQTLKKDTQKHVVTYGNRAMAAPGLPLFTLVGSGRGARLVYNVLPGQLVAYTISNGVATTVDDSTLASSDMYELYVGVGIDLNGDGLTDDIRHIGIENISGCEPREVSTSSPRCGSPAIMDFYFDCTQCDETYSLMVKVDDNRTQSFSPWNKSAAEFTGSIVTQCYSCDSCPPEHNCKEVACKLADAINADVDLKIKTGKYPDWKGTGLPRPLYATRLHTTSLTYCLSPQTVADSCEDCTYLNAITGVVINGTTHQLVGTTNPEDSTQTLLGQVDFVVAQIRDLFVQEYAQGQSGVDPHAGSAYATGSYQKCCPVQMHVNTCDAGFTLLGADGNAIAPTVTSNPFVDHGTFNNDANCIDCGDVGVKATGTLTLTDNAGNTETVIIGGKTYTFQTTLTNVNGNVLIGATAEDSLDNLMNAINLGAGAGTTYAAATTAHPTVTAEDGAGTTLIINALTEGTAGNAITTTETMVNGSFGGGTLAGGTNGTIGTTAYTCGIRVISEQIKQRGDVFIDKPLVFYGRKLDLVPFGDGWKGKKWAIAEVQAMELPSGFGSMIQWLEYQTLPEGKGRRYDRSNISKGWANLPGNEARVRNAVTARWDKNYCSYYIKTLIERRKLDNQYGTSTIHSNIHIPHDDSNTIASWEAFYTALIGFNPTCKTLTAVNCDVNFGGC